MLYILQIFYLFTKINDGYAIGLDRAFILISLFSI